MPGNWSSGMLLSSKETYHIHLSSISAYSYGICQEYNHLRIMPNKIRFYLIIWNWKHYSF